MTLITVLRHGQAQTGAKDEKSYDKLSDLGEKQAIWAGEYLAPLGPYHAVVTGTLQRQIQTGAGLALSGVTYRQDPGWNEMDYFGLAHALKNSHGFAFPQCQEDFQTHIRDVLGAWARAEVGDDLESYVNFRARILAAVRAVAAQGENTIVVSSTGVIATMMAVALDLDIARKTDVFLSIAHTSIHKFELVGDDLRLIQFCATPHLDRPDRLSMRTHI